MRLSKPFDLLVGKKRSNSFRFELGIEIFPKQIGHVRVGFSYLLIVYDNKRVGPPAYVFNLSRVEKRRIIVKLSNLAEFIHVFFTADCTVY